jgi:TM2 domain-containing membrane protein YozV
MCTECLIAGAMRNVPGGQILCQECLNAWQRLQPPFAMSSARGPNPAAAAALGVIPGVGAFYNGQFIKGFVHVLVFAVLCSLAADVSPFFGFGIPAWIVYQIFEAYHTAKALRDGQPPPDPLGLNEVGNWMNLGSRRQAGQPAAQQPPAAPFGQPPAPGSYPPPYPPISYPDPAQGAYQAPFTPPVPGAFDPAAMPPTPPPSCWRRREPIGAIVLIALGSLFLLGQLDLFHGRLMEFTWPVLLIALGIWLIVRRMGDTQGGCK